MAREALECAEGARARDQRGLTSVRSPVASWFIAAPADRRRFPEALLEELIFGRNAPGSVL
jgi:hypothetical protein